MKTLFLIRHAKSSWDHARLGDRQRPLSRRGRRDARRSGRRLARHRRKPDLLLSSPALRALTTAQLIASRLGCKRRNIVVDARLYACRVGDLLRVIHQLDDGLEHVMLFGHNPEFTGLARRLSHEIHHLPTCAVARFKFRVHSWSGVGPDTPLKVTIDLPRHAAGSRARSA